MKKFLFNLVLMLALCVPWAHGQTLFYEGFESTTGSSLPTGWTNEGTKTWTTAKGVNASHPSTAYQGNRNAQLYAGGSGYTSKLITPTIDCSGNPAVKLTFAYVNQSWSGDIDAITVYYRTDVSDSWHQIDDITSAHSVWTLSDEYVVSTSSSSTFQLAFECNSNYGYGVGIDDVTVLQGPSCINPTALTVSNITSASADISWSASGQGETQYQYIGVTSGSTPDWSNASTPSTSTSCTVNNLTPNTSYDVYVRSYCSESDQSSGAKTSFRTACAALQITASNPYTYGFEDATAGSYSNNYADFIPCWGKLNNSTSSDASYKAYPYAYAGTSYSHSGNNCVYFSACNSTSYPSEQILVFPEVTNSVNGLALSFWAKMSSQSYPGVLQLGVMTDPADATTFVKVGDDISLTTTYSLYELDLTTYAGEGHYVAIRCPRPTSYSYQAIYFDDVELSLIPPCRPLQSVSVSDITRTSLRVNWQPYSGVTNCQGYQVLCSTSANPDLATETPIDVNSAATLFLDIDNLERNTQYYIYVRSYCGSEDGYSEWTSTSATTKSLNDCSNAVTVADGTSQSEYIPVYGGYCDENQKTQSIYPASMLTQLVGKSISKLKYEVTDGGSSSWSSAVFQIRMKIVEASTLSGTLPTTDATLVYTGTLSASTSNGMEINLSTPFTYNGGNLLIEFNETQTSSYNTCKFKGTSVSSASYLANVGYGAGSYGFLPKVDFGYCETLEACPAVTNVTVSDIAQTTANLSWTASEGDYANTYDVLVSTTPVEDFTEVVPTYSGLDTCGQELTSLTQYTDYYVYVRVNCDGYGHDEGEAWSEAVQFTTLSNCITPTDFTVTPLTKTSAKAQWTATSQTSNYRYILSTEELTDPDNETVTASGITGSNVLLNRLTPGETYYLYLSNACGGEDGNSPYIFTTFTMPEVCIAPTEMNITDVQKYQMTLNWTPSQYADETDTYDIIVSDTAVIDFTGAVPTYTGVSGDSFVLNTLQRNTTYYVYIRTNCGEGAVTDWSEAVSATTLDVAPDCDNLQTVAVGDGSSSSTSVPANAYYNYAISEQIYTASEIGRAGTIKNLSFYCTQNGGYYRNFTVYLVHTSKSVFSSGTDWVTVSASDAVYSGGHYVTNNAWNTITFTTPFEYNGTDNLLVVIDDNSGNYQGTYASYRTHTADGNKTLYYNNDNTNVNPTASSISTSGTTSDTRNDMQFGFCGAASACPAVDAPVATDVTNTEATISWNAGTGDFATSYDLVISDTAVTDFEGVTLAADDVTETSFNAVGLAANTHYYTYVRVNCVNDIYDDGSSVWSPAGEFTTELPCLKPENFVAGSPLSDRVELSWIKRGTAVDWKIYSTHFDIALGEQVEDTLDVNIAACTVVEDTVTYLFTGLQPELFYSLRLLADCGETDSLSKFATGTPSFFTLSNNTKIDTMTITSAEVFSTVINREAKTIDFVVRKGSDLEAMYGNITLNHYGAQVRVNGEDFTQPWNLSAPVTVTVLAQDTNVTADWTITVTEEPCATPFNVAATDIERRTANLVWNIGDASTSFDFVISETALEDPATGTIQNITATNVEGACTYAITGMTRGTHYYVYVRTNCGVTFGEWRGTDFTTPSLTVCNEETIANGTNTSEYFPFYGNWQDTPGTKTQFIYGSDMLTELRGKSISKMTFYSYTSSQSFTGTNRVSIGITSDNSFSGAFKDSPSQVVFTGQVSVSGYQHTIEFDAPFEYPAEGGNLLIEYNLTTGGNCPHVYFYGINTSSNAGRCRTTDFTFLPKVTFEVCASTDACPEVTDVAIDNIGETSATVTWTESTGDYANTSDIYYSSNPDTTGVITPMVSNVTGNSAEITSLANYTIYYVWVRTHCDGEGQNDGVSPWAGGTSFRTLSPCRVPGTPEATITGKHTATVAWTNTSEGIQADNFTYVCSNMPVPENELDQCEPNGIAYTSTTADLNGLASGTTFYFYVKNVCTGEVNCSSPWDSCQFTMPAAMPAVINLQAFDIASNAFTATWESDSANFADETAWEIACVPAGQTPATWTTVYAREYFAIGLTPETSYDFYVRAKDDANYSENAMVPVTTTAVPADCKTIGDGTGTQYSIPCANYHNYGYSQQIFDASELQAGQITDIAFQYGSSSAMTKTNVKIYLGHTNKSEFTSGTDWVAADDLTEVYSGPFHCSGNGVFNTFTLTTPFNYNGTDNLVVAVHKENNGYEGSSYNFTYTYCSGSKTLYYQNDNYVCPVASPASGTTASFRNNVQFCFAPETCKSVTKLVVDNITTNRARAHWYPGADETKWFVYNSTEPMTTNDLANLDTTDCITVKNVPQIMYFGLSKDMDYYLYVSGECGDHVLSNWKGIHYTTLPSCSAPATAVATSEADNSITFTVTSGEYGTEGTYDYRYWIVGSDDTTTVAGQTSELTVNDLASSVYYAWEVRANCSGNGEGASRWVAGNDVHVCGAVTLPYSEGFETVPTSYSGSGMIETICWNDLNASANETAYPYYKGSTSYATEGNRTLQFRSSNVTPIYVIMPAIKDATECQVKFDCAYDNIYYSGKFQVGYMTDPADATTFVPVFTDSPTSTYTMRSHAVNVFGIPEGARIAFCYTAGIMNNHYSWLDNVLVDTIPYCTVATSVAPEVTPAIGSVEIAYNEGDTLSAGVFFGGSAPVFTAVPNEGIEFINWTNANNGDTLATVNPWTINIAQDTAIVANFDTASFNLNVMVAPGHDIYGEVAGSGTFRYGRTVNLSATPMDHYSVVWPDGNKENNRSIVMPAYDTTIVARFAIDKHQLTVAINDTTMGTVTGTSVYDYGTFVDITATPNDPEHMIFDGWSNGETDLNITIDLQHDSTVTANFSWVQHTITAIPVDTVRGIVTGGGVYNYGDTATLIAKAKFPYQFSRWDDDNLTEQDTFKVKVLGDATYTAYFKYNEFDVIARSADQSMGTVSGGGSYVYDTIVNISAIPNEHYHFVRWNNGSVDPITAVVVRGDTMLTAYFAIDQHAVVAQVNNTALGTVDGAGTYHFGATATLTATPAAHAVFAGWSNGETANPLSITVAGDTTITANFVVDTHAVTVIADDIMGTVSGAGNYAHGSMATISATPNYGYHFTQWNDGNTNNPRSVVVIEDASFTAQFAANSYNVAAVSDNNVMGSVAGAGSYTYNTSATLSATANYGYHFTQWNDGNTDNPRTLTVTCDSSFTAQFATNDYLLTVNGDEVMGSATGAGSYAYNTLATLSATANYGYHFTQWNDGSTINPRTVVVTSDSAFTAQFAANSYNVAAVSDNNVMGSVAGAGSYIYNTSATLSATANYGYHFIQWSDGNTDNPRTLTVTCDSSFTAQFATNDYLLTVNGDELMGSATGAGSYAYNTFATLTATANYGYHFTQWNDGNTINPRTVVVTSDSTFTAQFAANNYNVVVVSANNAMGSVAGAGSYTYNTDAQISATANYGYHFTQWSDGNTDNPRTLTVTCDSVFTAQFATNTYNLTLLADEVMGSVTGAGDFEYNASTIISASANYGYHFTGWSDGVSLNPRMITVTMDSTITALFAANAYHVAASVNIDEAGYVTGAADYQFLDQATLTATATPCYHFVSWNDGVTDNPRFVEVESDTAFTALFELNVYESEFTEVACDSYSWDNDVYTISGDYQHVYSTVNGCDSTVTLHLTVNYSDEGEFSDQASDLYVWDGREYTESGDYTFVYQNVYGCDSTMTLHLTIANFPTPLISQVNNRSLMVNHYPYGNNEYVDYADYRWYRNGELVASGSDNYLEASGLLNGCYTLEVPVNADKSVWVYSNELCFQNGVLVGIEDADAIEISFTVAPNPVAKGAMMTISTELPEHMLQGATLTMFDLSGRIITSMPMTQQSVSMTADQASGVYMIQIMTRSGEKQVKKVIVR